MKMLKNKSSLCEETALDEQIIAAALKRNPKRVKLQTNDKGHVIVDREMHPDIYDWAVNG
jgi:hypothetical protein